MGAPNAMQVASGLFHAHISTPRFDRDGTNVPKTFQFLKVQRLVQNMNTKTAAIAPRTVLLVLGIRRSSHIMLMGKKSRSVEFENPMSPHSKPSRSQLRRPLEAD